LIDINEVSFSSRFFFSLDLSSCDAMCGDKLVSFNDLMLLLRMQYLKFVKTLSCVAFG